MGPVIILDKSAFEQLSYDEHLRLLQHFFPNLTPVLAVEILGDLAKSRPSGAEREAKVRELAAKFIGSGPPVNEVFSDLSLNNLKGLIIPLEGKICPQGMSVRRAADGSLGAFIDITPVNAAIMRWNLGEFEDFERRSAELWRRWIPTIRPEAIVGSLADHQFVVPRASSLAEVSAVGMAQLRPLAMQLPWIEWLVDHLGGSAQDLATIRRRWQLKRARYVDEFAPYAAHCLRATLWFTIATRDGLIRWDERNLVDLQYLYYLPFCQVFVSNDKTQLAMAKAIAPGFCTVVRGSDFKASLRTEVVNRARLSDSERRLLGYSMGSFPLLPRASLVRQLWEKHCGPWTPDMGNRALRLSADEIEAANKLARTVLDRLESAEELEGGM